MVGPSISRSISRMIRDSVLFANAFAFYTRIILSLYILLPISRTNDKNGKAFPEIFVQNNLFKSTRKLHRFHLSPDCSGRKPLNRKSAPIFNCFEHLSIAFSYTFDSSCTVPRFSHCLCKTVDPLFGSSLSKSNQPPIYKSWKNLKWKIFTNDRRLARVHRFQSLLLTLKMADYCIRPKGDLLALKVIRNLMTVSTTYLFEYLELQFLSITLTILGVYLVKKSHSLSRVYANLLTLLLVRCFHIFYTMYRHCRLIPCRWIW